ncbi:hypothetical protein Q3H58_001455 [Pseudomonas psychrotolerans]|nr:hypothetical protein [Pseudomonas psychrotolerans]
MTKKGSGSGRVAPSIGHLPLFHGFEQCTLALRRGPVDLVGQQQLGEYRSGMEDELAAVAIEHRGAEDIAGQQIRGELDALEGQPQHLGQGMAEGGLAHAGQVLDQQVSPRQQAGQRQPDLGFLAQQNAVYRLETGVQPIVHALRSLALRRHEKASACKTRIAAPFAGDRRPGGLPLISGWRESLPPPAPDRLPGRWGDRSPGSRSRHPRLRVG